MKRVSQREEIGTSWKERPVGKEEQRGQRERRTKEIESRDGNRVERVRKMGPFALPHMVLSYPIPALPRMIGKIFLPHPCPLGLANSCPTL